MALCYPAQLPHRMKTGKEMEKFAYLLTKVEIQENNFSTDILRNSG